jgi:DNA-binding XRE family transcriptional regulator
MPKGRPPKQPIDNRPPTAQRLVRLRESTGMIAKDFARWVGIRYESWNQYENGNNLPVAQFVKLKARFPGLTSDWVYFGLPNFLSMDLAEKLGEMPSPKRNNTAS